MEMGRSCSPSFPRTVSLPALKNSIQNPVFFYLSLDNKPRISVRIHKYLKFLYSFYSTKLNVELDMLRKKWKNRKTESC